MPPFLIGIAICYIGVLAAFSLNAHIDMIEKRMRQKVADQLKRLTDTELTQACQGR